MIPKHTGFEPSEHTNGNGAPYAAPVRQTVPLATLHAHKRNYKGHNAKQIDRIARSLATFGQGRSVVIWHDTIIAGHGVVAAARALGWQTIQVDALDPDMPEAVALAYLVADNELARLADPDQAALAALLQELGDGDAGLLAAMGYDDGELRELLAALETPSGDDWVAGFGGLPDEDRAPFQQMTFTLHDEQAEQVKRAIGVAQQIGDFADSPNQNSNGNALALICETFVTAHGNG